MSTYPSRIGTASMIDRFTDACITSAARRWPAEIGESMACEWRAELAALQAERGHGRSWRAIRFTGSLALSPSVEGENQALTGWRGRAPGLGRAVLACLGVLGVATLAVALFNMTAETDFFLPATVSGIATDAAILCAIIVMALIGAAAARHRMTGTTKRSPYAIALTITAPIGIAACLVLGADSNAQVAIPRLDLVIMVTTWALVSTAAIGRALRAAQAGQRRLAWAIAILGALVALDVAGIMGGLRVAIQVHAGFAYAPAWFPLSIVYRQIFSAVTFGQAGWPGDHPIYGLVYGLPHSSQVLLSGLAGLTGPLLLCSGFVTAYALRAARAVVPANSPSGTADPLPAHRSRITSAIGAAGVVVGLCTWALVAGTQLGTRESSGAYNLFGELLQLRIAAISLVVVAAVVLLSGRGPVVLPAAGIFVVLFTADCIVARGKTHHLGTAAILLIVGAACVAGAWWTSGQLAGSGTNGESARRSLVGAAVAGAIAVPTFVGQRLSLFAEASESWAHADHTVIPADFMSLNYVLAVALWLVAIGAALAGRRVPMRTLGTVLYAVVPLVALILFASGVGEKALRDHLSWPADMLIEAPLAVLALAAARWDGVGGTARAVTRWLLLGVGAVLFTLPLVLVEFNPSLPAAVITAFEPRWNPVLGSEFDASTLVANQLLIALALGVLVARLVKPGPASVIEAGPDHAMIPAPSIA